MPQSKKEYFEENSDGLITYASFFQDWIESKSKTFDSFKKLNYKVLSSRMDERRREQGPEDFSVYDSGNRKIAVWEIVLENGVIWILSAPDRGTTYEWHTTGHSASFRKEIISKLENMYGL